MVFRGALNIIGNLIIGQGYQVKMDLGVNLTIYGISVIPENTPILLSTGWHLIGYLRNTPALADTMLSSLNPNIGIVKDGLGNVYWPQFGFNLIGDLLPGQGYQIKLLAADTLLYPPNPTCGGLITDYDGNSYNTVLIGTQCWMKENLKSTHYADGTAMVDGTNAGNISGNYTTKYYFDYNNNPANTATFGKLYTWAAVMNSTASSNTVPSGVQGICPTGWHVPGDEEWKILEGAADSQYGYPNAEWNGTGYRGYDAGKNLKATTGWYNNTGTDLYGFSALPGGYRNYDGAFGGIGYYGFWWSATEYNSNVAWNRYLGPDYSNVVRYYYTKELGFSVRCLRD